MELIVHGSNPLSASDSSASPDAAPAPLNAAFDLISDALPFGVLWYSKIPDAIGYAEFYSRSHHAVIRVYDEAGNLIATQEHKGEFKEW